MKRRSSVLEEETPRWNAEENPEKKVKKVKKKKKKKKKKNEANGRRGSLFKTPVQLNPVDARTPGVAAVASTTEELNSNSSTGNGIKEGRNGKKPTPIVWTPSSEKAIDSNWSKLKATLQQRKPNTNLGINKRKSEIETNDEVPESKKAKRVASDESNVEKLSPLSNNKAVTKVVALDCEMVGVGAYKERSMLARVCMINVHGNVIYDKFVLPIEDVVDYRTQISGVRPLNLKKKNGAEEFYTVQKEVGEILKGKILVGHALNNDLKALMISHPHRFIRDTQKYKPLKSGKWLTSLKKLSEKELGVKIQDGSHSPVEDARAALYIYLRHRVNWEKSLQQKKDTLDK